MRPHLCVIAMLSWLIPRGARADWRHEWEAELAYFELHSERLRPGGYLKLTLFTRSLGAFMDALWLHGTLYERLWRRGSDRGRPQRALALMVYALAAAAVAAINLVWTVDDTPLMAAMHDHTVLFALWRIGGWGAFLAFAAAAATGIPVLSATVAHAWASRRWDILLRLAAAPLAAMLVVAWLGAAFTWSGRQWIALPWDIAGDWPTPAAWPAADTRWLLGGVTSALFVAAVVGSAVSVAQAIVRSDLPPRLMGLPKRGAVASAGAIVLMSVGVAGWGAFANAYASGTFHSRLGGALGSTILVSWLASMTLLLAAMALAIRAAHGACSTATDA